MLPRPAGSRTVLLWGQWGWGGFNSRRLRPSRLITNLAALFYNWWNLYVRFFDEERHREAVGSRPIFMQVVGCQVQSGGQRAPRGFPKAENLCADSPDALSGHNCADRASLQFPTVKRVVAA